LISRSTLDAPLPEKIFTRLPFIICAHPVPLHRDCAPRILR
jgi:hypothetical protein